MSMSPSWCVPGNSSVSLPPKLTLTAPPHPSPAPPKVGAFPRREGMERKDLLQANTKIFKVQGEAIDRAAKKTVKVCNGGLRQFLVTSGLTPLSLSLFSPPPPLHPLKVLVVGNPANTNALVTSHFAPTISKSQFTCLTMLDHVCCGAAARFLGPDTKLTTPYPPIPLQNRACAQIAKHVGCRPSQVKNVVIWGNHSATQYPDVSHALVKNPDGSTVSVVDAVNDISWLRGEFVKVGCLEEEEAGAVETPKLTPARLMNRPACRLSSSAAQLSSERASSRAPCLPPRPLATTCASGGTAHPRCVPLPLAYVSSQPPTHIPPAPFPSLPPFRASSHPWVSCRTARMASRRV